MARDRDVAAFGDRALGYEAGWLGRLHHEIAVRVADLALAGAPEPRRVLDVGCLVLADLFSVWLLPTLVGGRRGNARSEGRAARLLENAGLRSLEWHHLYPLIRAVTAAKSAPAPRASQEPR